MILKSRQRGFPFCLLLSSLITDDDLADDSAVAACKYDGIYTRWSGSELDEFGGRAADPDVGLLVNHGTKFIVDSDVEQSRGRPADVGCKPAVVWHGVNAELP